MDVRKFHRAFNVITREETLLEPLKWREPLLGPLPILSLEAVDRGIVGGDAGPDARPMMLG